jgi:beta-lactam-binding protein with PASTA domain
VLCANVPSLVGRTLKAAKKALHRRGCADVPLTVERRARRREGRATVRAQTPEPGTTVHDGQRITVTIR